VTINNNLLGRLAVQIGKSAVVHMHQGTAHLCARGIITRQMPDAYQVTDTRDGQVIARFSVTDVDDFHMVNGVLQLWL